MAKQVQPRGSVLTLNEIVNVSVTLSGLPAARNGFDTGLIIGPATAISTAARLKTYTSADAMLDDGFEAADAEYKAALVYFSQTPKPSKLMIGVKGSSEQLIDALKACRDKSTAWYIAYLIGAEKADITAAAAWVEAQEGTVLFYDTADADTLSGASGNVFETLKALKYERTLGVYAEEGTYKAVALMGYALAANDGTANSAYTLAYKSLRGCAPTSVTAAQLETVKGNNGNIYIQRAETYDVFEQGVMASGEHFDTRIGLDQLAYNIQRSGVDLLANSNTKVPQTEAGMTQIKTAFAAECDKAVRTGFLAPGVWNGPEVLSLKTGDALSAGYLIQSDPMSEQTAAERASRKAPAIYVALKLAGAIESVVVKVTVDR